MTSMFYDADAFGAALLCGTANAPMRVRKRQMVDWSCAAPARSCPPRCIGLKKLSAMSTTEPAIASEKSVYCMAPRRSESLSYPRARKTAVHAMVALSRVSG